MIFGFLVAILPFTGFPREFREALSVLFGLIIVMLAFLINRKNVESRKEFPKDTFSENSSPELHAEMSRIDNPPAI